MATGPGVVLGYSLLLLLLLFQSAAAVPVPPCSRWCLWCLPRAPSCAPSAAPCWWTQSRRYSSRIAACSTLYQRWMHQLSLVEFGTPSLTLASPLPPSRGNNCGRRQLMSHHGQLSPAVVVGQWQVRLLLKLWWFRLMVLHSVLSAAPRLLRTSEEFC